MLHLLFILSLLRSVCAIPIVGLRNPDQSVLRGQTWSQAAFGVDKGFHPPRIIVGLLFESTSATDMPEQFVEISLGQTMSPFELPTFPLHPLHASIVNASITARRSSRFIPYDALDSIICIANPTQRKQLAVAPSWHRRPHRSGTPFPVWWTANDGMVNFEDSLGRFYLAGEEVESYECT